ncbi:MAG: ergothioneine biosynthesis protein EgtB [Myxococcales bacterium]|nr:ergothioneine biosynthesis protein EgtB [Myxococcales bacterium]
MTASFATPASSVSAGHLQSDFSAVRAATLALTEGLSAEDMGAQSMPEASPTKWHLAHTTWFFETFILAALGAPAFHPAYAHLFNSYYNTVGTQHARPRRGLLTRPSLDEVLRYRLYVDDAVAHAVPDLGPDLRARLTIGLHHEQQHQELILTDILHLLAHNPLQPAVRRPGPADLSPGTATRSQASRVWHEHPGGIVALGADPDAPDFSFDNESPRHRALLQPYALATRPVTNGEYLTFIADDGYARPELWLSDGWDAVQRGRWTAPLYWSDDLRTRFTLRGPVPIDPAAPVCHVSYYEADAYARWAEARLPTEAEWEAVAVDQPAQGNFVESGRLDPAPQLVPSMFGDVWVWTASPYVAYPGYKPPAGALGEYNGKFMCNQMVLRGGSCATPRSHVRASYRNFFHPETRWQFSGIRLAR